MPSSSPASATVNTSRSLSASGGVGMVRDGFEWVVVAMVMG